VFGLLQQRARDKPRTDLQRAWAAGCLTQREYNHALADLARQEQMTEVRSRVQGLGSGVQGLGVDKNSWGFGVPALSVSVAPQTSPAPPCLCLDLIAWECCMALSCIHVSLETALFSPHASTRSLLAFSPDPTLHAPKPRPHSSPISVGATGALRSPISSAGPLHTRIECPRPLPPPSPPLPSPSSYHADYDREGIGERHSREQRTNVFVVE
jgi:hypothetical protein